MQISKRKITWSDGAWTSIADLPLTDDAFHWEKAVVGKIAKRWIVQMWIWDAGTGQAKVQSLHWLVGELSGRTFSSKLDRVVRKREVLDGKPVHYNYDRWVTHDLKPAKGSCSGLRGMRAGRFRPGPSSSAKLKA